MKSRLTPLVCITVTVIGHLHKPWILTILKPLEEDSKFGKEHAKVVMELCIKSMILWWIRVSCKLNWWSRWSTSQKSIQQIKRIKVITLMNGTIDKEWFTIECGLHISQCIKQRVLTKVFGLQIYQELWPFHQVWSTTHTIFWPVTIITHHLVWTYLKVDISTLTSTIWLLQCPHNCMMVWSSMRMEHLLQLHKWPMTSLSILCTWQQTEFQTQKPSSCWQWPSLLLSIQYPTCSPSTITSIATLIDSRSMPWRTEDTRSSEKRCSRLTRLQVIGSANSLEQKLAP